MKLATLRLWVRWAPLALKLGAVARRLCGALAWVFADSAGLEVLLCAFDIYHDFVTHDETRTFTKTERLLICIISGASIHGGFLFLHVLDTHLTASAFLISSAHCRFGSGAVAAFEVAIKHAVRVMAFALAG